MDNARDFVASGGMDSVVRKALDSEVAEVREKAAILFGGCVQSHPDVQDRVLGSGWLPDLLERLSKASEERDVRLRLLHAVTNLVRGNSQALVQFRKENGFSLLLKLAIDQKTGKVDAAFGKKVLIFVADLAALSGDSEAQLVSAGPVFHKVVDSVVNSLAETSDLDSVEKRAYLVTVFGDTYGFQLKEADARRLSEWASEAKREVESRMDGDEFQDTLVRLDAIERRFPKQEKDEL